MSTKTSIKRIALVAVSALGFGMVTGVSAHAGASGLGTISVADKTAYCFVGDVCKALISVTTTGAAAGTQTADEVITLTPTITTQVTGATTVAAVADIAQNGTAPVSTKVLLRAAGAGASLATTASTVLVPSIVSSKLTLTPAASAAAGTYASGQLEFMANTPGKYVFTVTPATPGTGDTETAGVITVNVVSVGGTIGDGGAVASPFNAVNGVAGSLNYVTLKATGAARTASSVGTQLVVTGGTILSASAGTVSTDKTSLVIAGVNHATDPGTSSTITIATPAAGTITVKSYIESSAGIYSTTAADTVTITVNAAAQTGTLSVANSTSLLDKDATAGGSYTAPASDETVLVSKAVGTAAGVIKVTLLDSLSNTMPNTTTVTASISGPGSINVDNALADTTLTGARADSDTSTSGVVYVAVYADGTAGVGTITISVGTTTVATETVTFYGAVASLVGTAKVLSIAPGVTTAGVVEVVAKDANGNLIPSVSITGTASSTTAITSVTPAADGDADGDQLVSVGASATAAGAYTITFTDGTVTSAPVKITVGKTSAKTVTFTTDKDEYAPGELVTITVKAVDSNGNAVADGARALLSAAATSSVALQGTLPEATPTIAGGVKTYTVYAPLIAGDVIIKSTEGSATDNVAAGGTAAAISTVIKVVDPTGGSSAAIDAANEATDAANAATDAANAAAEAADAATAAAQDAQAAVAALATSVASLIAGIKAQITTLTNLVIKIQKKVRA